MVALAKKLRTVPLVAVLILGAVGFGGGCDDPAGMLPGGADDLATVIDGQGVESSGERSIEVAAPTTNPLSGVPAIPTRAPEPIEDVRHVGPSSEIMAAVIERLGGNPEARTMNELAKLVADLRDGDGAVETLIADPVDSPTGASMSIVVDRLGVPDDSLLGERLTVHGRPAPDHDGVELISVERQTLCRLGITADGRCL